MQQRNTDIHTPFFSYLNFWEGRNRATGILKRTYPILRSLPTQNTSDATTQHWNSHAPFLLPKILGVMQQGNRNLETHIPNFEKSSDLKNFRRNNATLISTRPFFSTIISGCDATGQQESWNAYTKFWKVFRPKKLPTQQCNTDFCLPIFSYLNFWVRRNSATEILKRIYQILKSLPIQITSDATTQHRYSHALFLIHKFLGSTQQCNRNLETHLSNFEKSSNPKYFRRNTEIHMHLFF